jgi:hypothetical protein
LIHATESSQRSSGTHGGSVGGARGARRAEQRYLPPYAFAHIGLGNTSAALDALERAFKQRDPTLASIKVASELAPLRDEPRFVALLEKMGLR